jgi:hypothetical protein
MPSSQRTRATPARIRKAEREGAALEQRKAGSTSEQIAASLGYSDRSAARKAASRALAATAVEVIKPDALENLISPIESEVAEMERKGAGSGERQSLTRSVARRLRDNARRMTGGSTAPDLAEVLRQLFEAASWGNSTR